MKKISKKMISLMISLALVMSMLVAGMVSAAEVPSQSGSLTITGSVKGEGAEEVNQVLEVSDLTLSYQAAETIRATVKAVVAGMDFFTLRAESDGSGLTFEIPQAMDKSIKLDFAAFASNMGSQLQGLLEGMGIDLNDLGSLSQNISPAAGMSDEEMMDMIAPYIQIFQESITECTTVENGVDIELPVLGTTVSGDLYTWAPTAEQFAEISGKLGTLLKEDDRLLVLYRQQLEQLRPFYDMIANATPEMSTEDLDAAYEQIYAVLDQLPDMLVNNAQEFGAVLAELKLSVQVGINGSDPALIKIFAVSEGEEMSFGIENASEAPDTKAAIFLHQGSQTDFAAVFNFTETAESSNGTVDILINGSAMGKLTYDVSKTEKTRIGLPVMNITFTLGGVVNCTVENVKGDEADVLSLDTSGISILMNGDNSFDGFHIEAAASDENKTEAIEGESIDVSGYTIEELGSLISQIGEGLTNYYNNL